MFEESDLEARVCKDTTAVPFDDPDGLWIRIAHDPAREDPDRDPRRSAVDESRDRLQLIRGELRGSNANQVGLSPVTVRPFHAHEVVARDRDRFETLDVRPVGLRRHALQVEHSARSGRGERRCQPLEVLLRPAKAAEEGESVAHPLASDEPDQRVIDAARFRADLHDHGRFPSAVHVEPVLRSRSDDGRGEGRGTALPIRPGAEDGVGETHGARFRPGDVFAEGRSDAEQVRRARVGGADAHRLIGPCDASLLLGERLRDSQVLPLGEIRSQRIHGRQHRDTRGLGKILEELEAGVSNHLVRGAGYVCRGDRHEARCIGQATHREEDFHRLTLGIRAFVQQMTLRLSESHSRGLREDQVSDPPGLRRLRGIGDELQSNVDRIRVLRKL